MVTQTERLRPRRGGVPDAAPVEYAEIRPGLRRARGSLVCLLLGMAIATAFGSPLAGTLKALAAALVLADVLAGGRHRSPLPSLLLDAVVLGAMVGVPGHLEGPAIALVGYVAVTSVLSLPTRRAVIPVVAAGAVVTLRPLLLPALPTQTAPLTDLLSRLETGSYVLAAFLVVLAAVGAMHAGRRRQAAAVQSERRASEVKNDFVSMVSHELRTPLTNIAGFAMALQESWRSLDPGEVDEFLTIVCNEAGHLRSLVDDVLVIPRLEAGRLPMEPADFPLRPAAFRIARVLFPPGGDKSASVAVGGNVLAHADPNRVEQVLRNLLENARKHGGDQVAVEASPHPDGWLVVVADNGPGVPAACRERIFAAFEQAEAGEGNPRNGMGLGLTVSRLLVEAMGGRIWYEPGFPIGARFCFTLPAAQAAAQTPAPNPAPARTG